MPWFVLYTRSRAEKKVAQKLQERGIDVYCPTRVVKRQWTDRVKLVEEPLFRSYVFVRLLPKDRPVVYGIPGFVRYLTWLGQPAEVLPCEIQAIRDFLGDYDHDLIQVQPFTCHQAVRIESGDFAGTEGTVIQHQGDRLRLHLPTLGYQLTLDLKSVKLRVC